MTVCFHFCPTTAHATDYYGKSLFLQGLTLYYSNILEYLRCWTVTNTRHWNLVLYIDNLSITLLDVS